MFFPMEGPKADNDGLDVMNLSSSSLDTANTASTDASKYVSKFLNLTA